MYSLEEKLKIIDGAQSFEEVRNAGILPEPDADDGYYFVSYSHRDFKSVLVDIIELQSRGIKIWYDRGLETGVSWLEDVCRKIDSYYCKGVMIYASDNLLQSEACQKELNQAIQSRKSCLVVKLNDVELTDDLVSFPAIDYNTDYEEQIALINLLPKPQLYEFYINKAMRTLGLGPCAMITAVNDRSIQNAVIPSYAEVNGKRYPVRAIGVHAFANCENLEEVTLPDGWITIAHEAFANCYSLKRVNLGYPYRFFGIFPIGSVISAFTNCVCLETINSCTKRRGPRMGGVMFMSAFQNCSSLKSINLPKHFILKGECFFGCDNLEDVTFNGRQCADEGMFASNSSLRQVVYDYKKNIAQSVQRYAFYYCTALQNVQLSKNIRKIETAAFAHCESLQEIQLPPRLRGIGKEAFAHSGLGSIRLPKSCNSVAKSAFLAAENLKTVVVDAKQIDVKGDNNEVIESTLDECFPYCETFYLKNNSRCQLSAKYQLITSDLQDYNKYVRIHNEYVNQ